MRQLPEVDSVLQQIEELSGRPVQFMEDRSLKVLSVVSTARHGAPSHVIRYRPSNDPLDYRITYQAGFTLRLFQTPATQRQDFVPDLEVARHQARELVRSGLELTAKEQQLLDPYAKVVAQWALMRLRSLPVGLRIDAWIRATFPALRSQQEQGMAEEQQQNLDGLSQTVGRLSVPRHLAATNAAQALFTDRLLGKEWYAIPYRAMGLLDDGARLLALNDELPDKPEHDCALIDRWAEQLGIRGWYRWTPYEP